jgi:hypothetical protein
MTQPVVPTIASYADIYQERPYYTDKYSDRKYDRLVTLKRERRKLEMMIRDYYKRYKAYAEYMKSRNGDWNDYQGRNDMAGLGLAPGDSSESAGWYYIGESDTVEECKRAALRDDKMYTRIVHYTPENGYDGTWKYSCYGSVPGAKTSANSRFNSIGVTTADRTYWVDEPVLNADAATILPPPGTTNTANYSGWTYLGKYPNAASERENNANGLYACKEMAKKPDANVRVRTGSDPANVEVMTPAAPGASTSEFNTILYLDGSYSGNDALKGACYARGGPPLSTDTIFLYGVKPITTVGATTTDISSGSLVYNNASQSDATVLYLSKKDLQIKNIPGITALLPGGQITIQNPDNPAKYQLWRIHEAASTLSTVNYVTVPVRKVHDSDYKYWNAPENSNVVVTLGSKTEGATTSYQTRCADTVGGDTGDFEVSGNSGPPLLKSQMVKDLRERYEAIMDLKSKVDMQFEPVPEISNLLSDTLDNAVYQMQTKWEPKVNALANKVKNLEVNNAMMDNADSHIQMNTNRYIFVFYTIYAALFICGLFYLLKADDSAPAVKYVQIALVGSFILWLAYHVTQYNN